MYTPFESMPLSGRFLSVIGSGGKTTFLRYMAEHLDGTVILTTSTHIRPFPDMPLITTGAEATEAEQTRILQDIRSVLSVNRILCFGQISPSGKLSSPAAAVPFEWLLQIADYVITEADGAAMHPLKAHRSFEPVIPDCSERTVCLVGASGIGKPVKEVCHCPDLFAALAGITPEDPADASAIARVLNQEDLADCYIVNQADALSEPDQALTLCRLIHKPATACSLLSIT